MEQATRTRQWLKGNNIVVNNDWLQACIEWIHEDNQGGTLSENELRNRVYEQWLLSDLHELETSCLPQCIQTQEKYELQGAYALQIDSILDVGTSFYSQHVKIKGKENANVHVNADDPNQKPWEPKPSRMLLFKLTDGLCNIQGMEYKPIRCLNPQTKPGTKIVVHGTVLCRHGVLMLSENNIKHLGGEVDTLVETNTVIQVLQSAMEVSETHAGKHHKQTFPGSAVRRKGQFGYQSEKSSFGGRNTVTQSGNYGNPGDYSNKMKMEPISQRGNIQQAVSDMGDGFSDDDEYLEAMDMDAMMGQPNNNTTSSMANSTVNPHSNSTGNVLPSSDVQAHLKQSNFNSSETKPKPMINIGSNSSSVYQMDRFNNVISNSTDQGGGNTRNSFNNKPAVRAPVVAQPTEFEDFEDMDFEDDLEAEFLMMTESANKKLDSAKSSGHLSAKNQGQTGHMSNLTSARNNKSVGGCTASNVSSIYEETNVQKPVPSNEEQPNAKKIKTENVVVTQSSGKIDINSSDNIRDTYCVGKVNTSNVTIPKSGMKTSLSINKSHQSKTIESFFSSNKQSNIKTESVIATKETDNSDIDEEYPFTYLRKVMSVKPPDEPSYHTVKAYISTLTSKLSSSEGRWTLSCKINDGSMAADVDLSDQVLTDLIGFSTKQSVIMRQQMKTNPRIKQKLLEGIKQCQQKLIDLMCLLELEICSKNPRPVIVATKQLNNHHIDMLHKRIIASWKT